MDCDCCGYQVDDEFEENGRAAVTLCSECTEEYNYMRSTETVTELEDLSSYD